METRRSKNIGKSKPEMGKESQKRRSENEKRELTLENT
jgi:hypothetical protein